MLQGSQLPECKPEGILFLSLSLSLSLTLIHTHTHKHKITILHYPSSQAQAQEHYIFLHYPHQQHKITFLTFLLDTDTVKIIALCTIGSDPFLCLETLCVNMFSLCVCICDLRMCVCR